MDRQSFRSLAKRVANTLFLMKLRDRQIRPETMPDGFITFLAAELGTVRENLVAYFALPPRVHHAARYKSDSKPEVAAKVSFKEAVRTSGLSDEEQRHLLSR